VRNGMYRKGELTLEQSAESREAVGVNGFPHRYQRGNISFEMLKADSLLSIGVVPRSLLLRLLMEDGAFLYLFPQNKHKEDS